MFIVSIPYHPRLPLLREVGSGARLYITHHTKRCIEVRPCMYLLNKLEVSSLLEVILCSCINQQCQSHNKSQCKSDKT